MSYAIEKLNTIYYKLAVGEGDIKQRLISVEIELLCITKPDLLLDLQEEWAQITKILTKKGTFKDHNGKDLIGAIPNTISSMQKRTAVKLVKQIIEFYYKVKMSQ